MSEKPGPLSLGVDGGMVISKQQPDGRRTLDCALYRLDAESAPKLAAYLVAAQPWLDGTGVSRATQDTWEHERRPVVIEEFVSVLGLDIADDDGGGDPGVEVGPRRKA